MWLTSDTFSIFFPAAVPALRPLVHDLFVLRGSSKSDANKELDTQREVVVSMLLRLIYYYEVSDKLIDQVVNQLTLCFILQ